MKHFFAVMISSLVCSVSYSQDNTNKDSQGKHPIDTTVLGTFPYVNSPSVTDDGRYFMCFIDNLPMGSRTLMIKETQNQWKREITDNNKNIKASFSSENSHCIVHYNDTLLILSLKTKLHRTIAGVESYQCLTGSNSGWLVYKLKNKEEELVLLNLKTEKLRVFSMVSNFTIDKTDNSLLINRINNDSSSICWIDLPYGKELAIWASDSEKSGNYSFDETGNQVAFTSTDKSNTVTIWYFEKKLRTAEIKVQNTYKGIDSGLYLTGKPQFSKNGKYILFSLKLDATDNYKDTENAKVNIWSYRDILLRPEINRRTKDFERKIYLGAVGVNKESKIIRLEYNNERVPTQPHDISGDYVILFDNASYYQISTWWKLDTKPNYYLLSLKDGSRRLLKKESNSLHNFSFSPGGDYLVYWDRDSSGYYIYDFSAQQMRSLKEVVPVSFCTEYPSDVKPLPVSSYTYWVLNGKYILLYDNYDIWKIDPSFKQPPLNITNGYGKKNDIKFRFVEDESVVEKIFNKQAFFLLAFNNLTKQNGFFKYDPNKTGDPELLSMESFNFYRDGSQNPSNNAFPFSDPFIPGRNKNSTFWLLRRESYNEAPNFFLTRDFKQFTRLTELQPHKKYNWLTAELINYMQLDGTKSQGVLYKPENFNPARKYPVIFNYYEKLSHRLYEFPYPEYTYNNINIPWFVSQGYLVFIPDIYYSIARENGIVVGQHAFNSIVAAANHLSKLPYVDSTKIGLQGHSFGGLQTAFVITHTTKFAAAAEVAGSTDPISAYLTLIPLAVPTIESIDKQIYIENSHEFYGCNPWECQDLYLKNSAVLAADRVSTPLLIMHNMNDGQVQFRQGIELYMALRRLHKKCWLLQYENAQHSVIGKDAVDFTIRLTQFFNYYLKNDLPPKWMMQRNYIRKLDLSKNLELDSVNSIP